MAHFRYSPKSWQFECLNGCIDEDELVYTTDGLIKIKNITEKTNVYTFKDNKMEITPVKYLIDQGIQEGFEVKTTHRRIIATDIHPFLVLKNNKLIWKSVKDLEINDEVVIASKLPDTTLIIKLNRPNDKYNLSIGKDGRDYNWLINDIKCPEYGTKELARLWGFLVGDGWISESTGQIGFALSLHDDLNEKYIDLFEDIFQVNLGKTNYKQMYIFSRKIESFFKNNDWVSGCENKKIPEWILQSSDEVKSEFLEGYIDADGYRVTLDIFKHNRCNFETINYNLLHDLKELINSLGYRCNSIVKRNQRNYDTYIEGRKIDNKKDQYMMSFSYTSLNRKNDLILDNNLNVEKIKSIESVGDRHVYDISVEGDSKNFIANGMVAHNTSMLMSLVRTQDIIWQIENDLILLGHATVKPPVIFACGTTEQVWKKKMFTDFIASSSTRGPGGDIYTHADVKTTPLPAPTESIQHMVKYLGYHDTQRTIALGVPPQLLGQPEGSSRTTAEVSFNDWINILEIIQIEISDTLEEQVFRRVVELEFGEGAPVPRPIWNTLFEKSEDTIVSKIISLKQSGILSVNEARDWLEELGLKVKSVKDGDIIPEVEMAVLQIEELEKNLDVKDDKEQKENK